MSRDSRGLTRAGVARALAADVTGSTPPEGLSARLAAIAEAAPTPTRTPWWRRGAAAALFGGVLVAGAGVSYAAGGLDAPWTPVDAPAAPAPLSPTPSATPSATATADEHASPTDTAGHERRSTNGPPGHAADHGVDPSTRGEKNGHDKTRFDHANGKSKGHDKAHRRGDNRSNGDPKPQSDGKAKGLATPHPGTNGKAKGHDKGNRGNGHANGHAKGHAKGHSKRSR